MFFNRRYFKPTHFRIPFSTDYQCSSAPSKFNTEEEILLWGYEDKVKGLNHASADSGHSHTKVFAQSFNAVELERNDSSQYYPEWVSNGHRRQCLFEGVAENSPEIATQSMPILNHIVYCNAAQATNKTNSQDSFDRAIAPVNPYKCISTYCTTESDSGSVDDEKIYEIQIHDNDSLQDEDECYSNDSSQTTQGKLRSPLKNGTKLRYASQ